MLTAVFNIIIPIVAGLALLAGVYFLVRAIAYRMQSRQATYGVGQQDARLAMQIDLVRALAAGLVGLIFLGVSGLGSRTIVVEPTAVPVPTRVVVEATSTLGAATSVPATPVPTATAPLATPSPRPQVTNTSPLPSPTSNIVATDTPESIVDGVTVIAPAGLWLRGEPSASGEQLEWLLVGTVLMQLPGQQTADDIDWQQVQTDAGVMGWVAADFLDYGE